MRIYRSASWIEIPRDQNLTELLHTTAVPLPESHLVAKDNLTNRSITLGQLRDRAGRLARGLHDRLQPPDQARWAIVLPSSVDFLEIVHAILWTGGVVCPINWALKAAEIGHGLAVSRPHYIVAYGPVVPVLEEAIRVAHKDIVDEDGAVRGATAWPRPVILTIVERAPGLQHVGEDFVAAPGQRLPVPHYPDTARRQATIHLSSGTTGQPKGVQLSHYNFVANVRQLYAHDPQQFHPGTRCVSITPWAHIAMTTMPLFSGPYMGLFHHAMPAYDLETFAQLAGSVQATSFQGPPSAVLQLARTDVAQRHDFSRAQVLTVGGAPFQDDVLRPLLAKAPWQLVQLYGMTEAAGYVAYQRLGEAVPAGAVGHLLPNMEACLKKQGTAEDVAEGEAGELWLRGPNMTTGYVFNEKANRAAFPAPGWYNTGDLCRFDTEGRISIVGRTKELIKYKGFQVPPAELEAYLNAHPLVHEAGVAATWDESQLTELPTAWVVLAEPVVRTGSEEAIARALREVHASIDQQVSGYKKLRGGVWHVQALPKNPTGKILRQEMAAMRDGLSSLPSPKVAKAKL